MKMLNRMANNQRRPHYSKTKVAKTRHQQSDENDHHNRNNEKEEKDKQEKEEETRRAHTNRMTENNNHANSATMPTHYNLIIHEYNDNSTN